MTYLKYILVLGLCFFAYSIPSAFASVTTVSTDPSYATEFSFYCQPYTTPFQSGNHYMAATNTGTGCYYSLPSTLASNPTIELRAGTPTNSTLLSTDFISDNATKVRQQPHGLPSSPADEDDFFAVVYNTSLGSDFSTYLTSGGALPPGAVENQSYYILPWKWGPTPVAEFEPVIIVPDILTTWQTSDGPVVDPVFHQYQNLLDTFVANGYVLNQTVFMFPYNWEQSNVNTATELKNFIATVKTTCGCDYVDLIGHGMGGLIGQQYIESPTYDHDVSQLLFLGTPLNGLPSAYLAWEGAQVRFGNTTSDSLAQALITQEAKDAGYPNTYAYIQNAPVASFKELLPSQYSNYHAPTPSPYNQFIEDLIANFSALLGTVRFNTFMADDGLNATTETVPTTASTHPPLWPDGEPTNIFTASGDGVVPNSSVQTILEPDYTVLTNHQLLPTAAQDTTFSLLNNRNLASSSVQQVYPVNCVLFLTTSQPADLQVTDPNGNRLGKNFVTNGTYTEIPNAFYSGANASTEYGVVVNPAPGNYQVTTQGSGSGSFTINTTQVCGGTVGTTTASSNTNSGQIVGFNLVVTPDAQGTSITITSLDMQPPVVTISSPVHGQSYFSNTTIPLSVIITDPENSPIATTVYKLNNAVITATTTLNLATLPLGTSTLVVSATDSFGNTGYATSSFGVLAPPPPAAASTCLFALNATEKAAIKINSSSDISLQNCIVQVNSNATGAFDISGSSDFTSSGNCIVGTVKKVGSSSLTPAPTIPCPPKADPFASHATPTVGACTYTNKAVNGSATATLTPGVYCGGLNVGGSAKVTFSPGLYIMKGPLTINGSAKVTGTGVSFFLTGNNTAINFSGSAQIKLKAMSTGVLAGFLFFLDPAGANAKSEINGSTKFTLEGVVYLPQQELRIGGSAQVPTPSPYTVYIADTFYFNGSVQLRTNIAASNTTLTIPAGL